ncbi:hypothetical protein [Leuconostoc mesenteroides]|uniref:hypothetical protein n=1 Tax=Leuconostoc mesenteroides TaxID=1245 RepID=UPI002362034D|nr:hypothetical protein [Leuconostoc mesenteroides]
MSKNQSFKKFSQNIEKRIKEDMVKKAQNMTINCPNCHSSIEVTIGDNVCPFCHERVNFSVDSSNL